MSQSRIPPATPPGETDVYAIHGADPEVLAYAMAKYSRSALTMRESLAEISSQRAEQFLNTFYFQYGHRSIADLAHIPFAIERLSLLAAIALVDEQRWDGQERSTRYQNFRKSGWFTPSTLGPATPAYTSAIESLFHAYEAIGGNMHNALKAAIPQPPEMDPGAYDRTLKARAFDVARYLLPLATNTSLGQIVNARTLETQVSRLLTSPLTEVRNLAEKLRIAATEPAWNLQQNSAEALHARIATLSSTHPDDPTIADSAADLLLRPIKTAPTLVKYAKANPYQANTRAELAQAAAELMANEPIDPAPVVDLIGNLPDGTPESLELELATSLLYPVCHYSYRQLRANVAALPAARRDEIIALGTRHRSHHDELLRAFSSGVSLRFDILMDIGGFRDMHRHRRCIQLLQDFTDLHGYEEPTCPGQPTLAEAGLLADYTAAMDAAFTAYRTLRDSHTHSATSKTTGAPGLTSETWIPGTAPNPDAAYLLPLGTRCRSLFKMDFAEALYIAELRSTPAGHFSYRRVAWEMFRTLTAQHPTLAHLFRIEDVNQPIDLLKR